MSTAVLPLKAVRRPPGADGERHCQHCGSLFRPRREEELFCCAGCRVVHDAIHLGGLGGFYELLGRQKLDPANEALTEADLGETLDAAIDEAEASGRRDGKAARLRLLVGNLSCTACVWLVDHLFRQHAGAVRLATDTGRSLLTLWWTPGEFAIRGFLREMHRFGYPATLHDETTAEPEGESRALVTRVGVTAGLAMNTMAFTLPSYLGLSGASELSRLFGLVAFASASLAVAVGGSYFFQRAWRALRAGMLHMDVPIALGIAAAYLGSVAGQMFGIAGLLYFDFVALFTFLMLAGRWLHLRLLDRNRIQLAARSRSLSTITRLGSTGQRDVIPFAKVAEWDALEVARRSLVPTRALLVDEEATFLLDWITGEPDPITVRCGQDVPAGARNSSERPVRLVSLEPFQGSLLEGLLSSRPDEDGSPDGAVESRRWLKGYMASVLVVAFAGAAAWALAGPSPAKAFQVLISVLVVSCPCALGLALPLLNERILGALRERGIYVRRHSLWSRLKKVRRIAFDKTGTLTEAIHRVANPGALEALTPDALPALRTLTERNEHPCARAIREELCLRLAPGEPMFSESYPAVEYAAGKGAETWLQGDQWRLGRADWACHETTGISPDTRCVLSRNGARVASFAIAETLRDGAAAELEGLRRKGFRLGLISGDPDGGRVRRIAGELGLDESETFFNQSPEAKAALLREHSPETTLFVGDGGNDRFALDLAAVKGCPATGARDVESRADFVFAGRGFRVITRLLAAGKRRQGFVALLFCVTIPYNLVAIGVCLAGHMSPLLAAILMPLSSVATLLVAARATAGGRI